MGKYLNDYRCEECGYESEKLVTAESIGKSSLVVVACEKCKRPTQHRKLLGGLKSRYFFHDPRY